MSLLHIRNILRLFARSFAQMKLAEKNASNVMKMPAKLLLSVIHYIN